MQKECLLRQTCVRACGKGPGAITVACMCMECKHIPMVDFVWFAVECSGERSKSSKGSQAYGGQIV